MNNKSHLNAKILNESNANFKYPNESNICCSSNTKHMNVHLIVCMRTDTHTLICKYEPGSRSTFLIILYHVIPAHITYG